MTPLAWMIGVPVLVWAVVSVLAPAQVNPELLLGMLGPLASVVATWVVTVRAQRSNPARVTSVMVAALAAKMVFFGVYVVLMLGVVGLRYMPFVIGFTSYLIGLYVMEALFLKRLFLDGMRSSSSA
jgi:hypothetical protein